MSCVFEVGDVTVWSPLLRVGRVFVETAEAVWRSLGVPTGITAEAEDLFGLDAHRFPAFINDVGFGGASHHLAYRSMVRGLVAVGLVMMERAGIGEDLLASAEPYAEELSVVRRSMPF
jgi:hypothetical protein